MKGKKKQEIISRTEVEKHRNAKYEVKTITPLEKEPIKRTYILNQMELNSLLANYNDYAEFIISIKVKKTR